MLPKTFVPNVPDFLPGPENQIRNCVMKKLVIALSVILSFAAVSACNTVSGIGKDIEKGGQAIGRAAK